MIYFGCLCLFQGGDENSVLPYWLSNSSALLCLLQRNLQTNSFLNASAQRSGRSAYVSSIEYLHLSSLQVSFYMELKLLYLNSHRLLFIE